MPHRGRARPRGAQHERGAARLSARLSYYGGVEEIGGNKFLLEAGRTRVFLDFGMSFGAMGAYFSDFLGPRKLSGLGDHWSLDLLPRMQGVYRTDYLQHMGVAPEERAVDAVLVSHAHMDHIGDIPFLRHDIPVVASPGSFGVMRALEETGAGPGEYLSQQPQFRFGEKKQGGMKKLNARDLDPLPRDTLSFGPQPLAIGDLRVQGVAEDHSLPGASGMLVEAPDVRVAYTGDFRFHGRHGHKSWGFVDAAAAFEPDVLLIEGTRVSEDEGTSEAQVAARLQQEIQATEGLAVVNWPVRDTDRLLSFYEATKRAGRELCISTRQARVLQQLRDAGEEELPSLDDRHLRVYVRRKGWGLLDRPAVDHDLALGEYQAWERDLVDHPRAITAREIREAPQDYVVRVDFFELNELIDLQPPQGSRYIRSVTEPFDEEMEIDQERADRWLKHFGLFPYVQAHASGHASGPELWKAIGRIQPRAVVPIHTEHHELFEKHLAPLGIEVRKPAHALKGGKAMEL